MMFLNSVRLFCINAMELAVRVGRCPDSSKTGASTGLTLSLLSINSANAAKPNGPEPSFRIFTCLGGSNFWLYVPGTRKTRAASAVQFQSISNPSCLHRRLKFSATGFHWAISTSSVKGQYTWNPPPEDTTMGSPSVCIPVVPMNSR